MADPDNSLTPEQRLLKLIEESDGDPASSSGGDEPAVSVKEQEVRAAPRPRPKINFKEVLSPAAIRARIEHLKDSVISTFQEKKHEIKLGDVNRLLVIIVAIIFLILAVNVLIDMGMVGRDYMSQFDLTQKQRADVVLADGQRFVDGFLEGIGKRNVFTPYVAPASEKVAQESDLSLRLVELTRPLKLTGISYSDDPQRTFCMIEDLQKNITTFLRTGDSISGMTVSEIKPDSIVLKLGQETIELR